EPSSIREYQSDQPSTRPPRPPPAPLQQNQDQKVKSTLDRSFHIRSVTETAVHGSGGTVSASIRRRWTQVRERPTRAAPHRRSDGAPAPVLRRHGPRVPRAGGPRARPAATPRARSRAGSGGAGEVPFVAHLRHAAEHEATKAHRLLALGVPAKDVRHARGAE